MRVRIVAVLLPVLLATGVQIAAAAVLPAGFSETLVAGGLSSPTAMTIAPDGRIFVCEQGGTLRVISNGTLLPTPFVSVSVNASGERGLLGVALDPAFATNGYVYIYYTTSAAPVHNRISRFTANGNVAVPGSELALMNLENLSATNHNGGALEFGPDGKLYVAVGENADAANSQVLTNRLGKMLRLNSDGTIPTDNPFYSTAVGDNRAIWALGLRNPFTFAFNPGGPVPTMLINDVGGGSWEEINDGGPGRNYGWPLSEGPPPPVPNPAYTYPRHAYGHGAGGGCAITGGAFYAPAVPQFPAEYLNDYFFADFCSGFIRRLDPANGNTVVGFATGISSPVDLDVAADGALYYLARGSGAVYRVVYGQTAPTIVSHPASQTVSPGATVTFSVQASGISPFGYQWQRNGANIAGATSASYQRASVTLADDGARFRVNVSNAFGNVFSNEAVLTVTTNQPPVGTITTPAVGTLYAGGAVIAFAGTATDPESGALPDSAFTWRVDFHHDTHTHPFVAPTSGVRNGTFAIPTTGETSANVWYRIHLTVTDPGGRTHTITRDVLPQRVRVTLTTSPASLGLLLDGQPVSTPVTIDSVVGMLRTVEARSLASNGTSYDFAAWSDGGASVHAISTPSVSSTFQARFRSVAVSAPPSAPTGLAAHVNGASLELSWNAAPGATSYRLEGGTASGLADLLNSDVGDTTRIAGTVPPGQYFARVRAVNALGVSGASNQVTVTVASAAACVSPPPVPTGYSVQTSGLSAYLSWAASPGAQAYVLDVGSTAGATDIQSINLGSGTTLATTAPAGTYYTRLRATNGCGASAPSAEVAVTLGCGGPPSPVTLAVTRTGSLVRFSWVGVPGAVSYRLQAGTAQGASNVIDADLGPATSQQVDITGAQPGTYFVRAIANHACGSSVPSNEVTVVIP